MRGHLVLLGVLVASLAAGCGGGSKSAAPTTTTSAAPGFTSTENCRKLEEIGTSLAQAITPGSGNGIDPDKYAAALRKLTKAAPAEIRPDFKTFADAYTSFVATLKASGYVAGSNHIPTPAQLLKLTAAARKLATPEVKAAERRLAAWGRANCTKD